MRTFELKKVFENKQWQHQWLLFYLTRQWPVIVGEQVAAATYPAYMKGKVLWIYAENSVWMQQLQFIKLDILAKIKQGVPDAQLQDLRFVLDPEGGKKSVEAPAMPPITVDKQAEKQFMDMIAAVADAECRNSLHKMWLAFAGNTKTETE